MTFKQVFFFIVFSCLLTSCSSKYVRAMKLGEVSNNKFKETLPIDVINQLTIVPVHINGKTYRFLFDTGAPFSISNELQNTLDYKVLHKATLTDSDKSKLSLDIVQVDSINIGSITFTNQTAFIANFNKNKVLNCLNIDGIVGSNLMKHCNWTVDMQNEILQFSKGIPAKEHPELITIPFITDKQYDIHLKLKIGQTQLQGVKLDYGSNGSLSLPHPIFEKLKKREFDKTVSTSGFVQAGLFGIRKPLYSEMAKVDSMWLDEVLINNVLINSGKNGLLGGKILSNYIVHINWDTQTLSFAKHNNQYYYGATFGFRIGYTDKLIIQSIVDGSQAQHHGLLPNMEIIEIDHFNFTTEHTLCDYMNYFQHEHQSIRLVYKTLNGIQKEVTLTKSSPFEQ